MRTTPQMLLRGVAKFVAVVIAAGLAGAGIGIALAELSGNDGAETPLLPATTAQTSTSQASTVAAAGSGARTTTTASVYRIPSVRVLSAQIAPPSESTGRALVAVRTRVTNRGTRDLEIKTPALVSGDDEVPLGEGARDAAGPLLRPIAGGESATAVLRFTVPSTVAERLQGTPTARLRVANRTVVVNLSSG